MRTNDCPRKISTTTQFTKTATRSTTRIRPNKWRCNPATAQINKIWDVRSNVSRWKTTKCRILCNISISDDSRGRFNILLIVILQNKERKKNNLIVDRRKSCCLEADSEIKGLFATGLFWAYPVTPSIIILFCRNWKRRQRQRGKHKVPYAATRVLLETRLKSTLENG